jgi:hypothetical protein
LINLFGGLFVRSRVRKAQPNHNLGLAGYFKW